MKNAYETTCFECLEGHIRKHFSDSLIFRYGISDSAFPFGNTAVVQVNLSGDRPTSDDNGTQFVLVRAAYQDGGSSCDSIEFNFPKNDESESQFLEDGIQTQGNGSHRSWDNDHTLNSNCATSAMSLLCFNWNVITASAPVAYVGTACYSTVEEIFGNFVSGSIEDQVISSLNLLVVGKPPGRYASDFLNLVGLHTLQETKIPNLVRHPNIIPLIGVLRTDNYIHLLYPKAPYTLENILHYSPCMMKSDWHIRFLIYQVVSAVKYLHSLGISHGGICPSNIMLTDTCWSWLNICNKCLTGTSSNLDPATSPFNVGCCTENCPCPHLYADLKLSISMDWNRDFKQWWAGELSNYEYLLVLNRLAGRRWGDHTLHTVMPWVIDFTIKPDDNSNVGWRDLRKSKWRLAKGDEQLDFTYLTSEIPHHVSDECLSELAVCSYKARRLPLHVLRSAVRSVYEPNEYPSSMQRLYQWTPDECIPEFYSDPRLFFSLHPGMSDLAVPSWASSPEEFISLHRGALESNHVSQQIHHWIDITFGYKLSGEASIAAKNVMLSTSDPSTPKSSGRRQLFTRPHPKRRGFRSCMGKIQVQSQACELSRNSDTFSSSSDSLNEEHLLPETRYLQQLEEVSLFCEHSQSLHPIYNYQGHHYENQNLSFMKWPLAKQLNTESSIKNDRKLQASLADINLVHLLEYFEVDDNCTICFPDLLMWSKKSSYSDICSEKFSDDMFSVGCVLAELYLGRPLFDYVSLAVYAETGIAPDLMMKLPSHIFVLVEKCIQRDWRRRPSAKHFLESTCFPPSIKSAYVFVAPLQLLAKPGERLQYFANLATQGAFRKMGKFTLEMCVPYFIPLILRNLSDVECESAICLLKELMKYLKSEAIKNLILPAIQKILQMPEYVHMKVSLLQESFLQEVWKRLGKQVYLEKIHSLVIFNLYNSPKKMSASAASILLICSSEELGIPVTLHQTILPLLCCFGRGLCADGIDALVRIGGVFGETFIVKQLLPLLKNVVLSLIEASLANKTEPQQSWNSLALVDSFTALNGLATILPEEAVLQELIMGQICLHIRALMQAHLDLPVVQVAATTLVAICQRIGPDYTALHVLPKLRDLFDELAFSQEVINKPRSLDRNPKSSALKVNEVAYIRSRMDLVVLLYPSFASLVGIEKLRQCCTAWLLLEQYLQQFHNWKWEFIGESSKSISEKKTIFAKISASEYSPAKLLVNGVGWSVPQSQGPRGYQSMNIGKQGDLRQKTADMANLNYVNYEQWFWLPNPAASWDTSDFFGHSGGLKDDLPWKIKASILYSTRAHPGALRSLDVLHDECTIFTAGVGPGFKGSVQKWELPRMSIVSGYYGHDEVVNDVRILSTTGRIASCDGTVHVWNSQTGKLIAAYAEPSTSLPRCRSSTSISSIVDADPVNILNPTMLSGGMLSSTLGEGLYTCMHYLEADDLLVVGMGNSSLRFIDVAQDRKLHLWKNEMEPCSFSSLVSAICSCGSTRQHADIGTGYSSWIAAGLSSGHCRLLDRRSGDVIAFWRAHDGYITKLAAPEDHLLVSSSLDKTLRVWDLRKNLPSQSNVLKGHSDGISSFAIWGRRAQGFTSETVFGRSWCKKFVTSFNSLHSSILTSIHSRYRRWSFENMLLDFRSFLFILSGNYTFRLSFSKPSNDKVKKALCHYSDSYKCLLGSL